MFLTTNEVAKKLGCSPDNIRRMEREGQLYAEKTPSGRRIFTLESVERLVKERARRAEEKQQAKKNA